MGCVREISSDDIRGRLQAAFMMDGVISAPFRCMLRLANKVSVQRVQVLTVPIGILMDYPHQAHVDILI
jgi:hypothetical protein